MLDGENFSDLAQRRLVLTVIEMVERGEDVRALLPKVDVASRKGGL